MVNHFQECMANKKRSTLIPLATRVRGPFVCYGPSYFPADWIYGPSAKFVSHKSGLEKTRFVRYLAHLWVQIDEKGFNSNNLLNLAGGAVKYGPLN